MISDKTKTFRSAAVMVTNISKCSEAQTSLPSSKLSENLTWRGHPGGAEFLSGWSSLLEEINLEKLPYPQ